MRSDRADTRRTQDTQGSERAGRCCSSIHPHRDTPREGILATTSRHQPDEVQPEKIQERVDAYAKAYENLRKHDAEFPAPELLKQRIGSCQSASGMADVGESRDSEGSRRIIEAVDRDDPRPLWISV
jgi:hypothetical protein